jgi:hypothetical protein
MSVDTFRCKAASRALRQRSWSPTRLAASRRSPLSSWAQSFAALLLICGLAACARAPAEQRLREALAGLQAAVEAREVSPAMEHVAEDFVGNEGLDREGARNLLRLMVLRHQSLGLSLGPYEIELHGERATVRFTAVATGGSGALIPESARVWNVETGWREDGGEWRLISAQWR